MTEISLEEICSLNLGELVDLLYKKLKEMNATSDDVAEVEFGNMNFRATLKVNLKDDGGWLKNNLNHII